MNKQYKQNKDKILENAKKYYLKNRKEQNRKACLRQKAKQILSERHKEEYKIILDKLKEQKE